MDDQKDREPSKRMAYLSLGSNVGDREGQLRDAVKRLAAIGRMARVSAFFESEPVEFTAQPWFLNCAVALETKLNPVELMAALLEIEKDMGRRRVQKKGPRTIDIDILIFGDLVTKSEDLTIPHPAMQERRFVLEPLAEIAAGIRHPAFDRTIRELRDSLPPGQSVKKFKSTRTA
jgi:2-amino-4-hydroxy-6-hydroxymethyldihydropteridine diphosphokinase